MKIASWNVNGLRARLDFIKIWLASRQPDVVGLQELKVTEEDFPFDEFSALGYHVEIHAQKGWNGVGILSREPIDVETRGLPGEDDFGARLITGHTGGLSFTTIYVPNGKDVGHDDFPLKIDWLGSLADHWKASRSVDDAAVLCGDFNIVPEALDSWRGEDGDGRIFHTTEERERFAAIRSLGLLDLYREKHPAEQTFSWWDYRGGAFHRGHGLRIDFLLGTKPILDRTGEVWIDRDFRKKQDGLTASDHAPVIAELD
ncbi:MAG: exodeoxyribonuclease III [Gammaproteobacteria bacterium]|nr:exodeoxyribonuclease III [Gammaproteobacteria bacterium]